MVEVETVDGRRGGGGSCSWCDGLKGYSVDPCSTKRGWGVVRATTEGRDPPVEGRDLCDGLRLLQVVIELAVDQRVTEEVQRHVTGFLVHAIGLRLLQGLIVGLPCLVLDFLRRQFRRVALVAYEGFHGVPQVVPSAALGYYEVTGAE